MTTKQDKQLPDYRVILLIAFTVITIYLLSPILTPFLVAAILAYICTPLVDKLEGVKIGRFTIGRTIATLLVMLLVAGLIVLLLLIVIPLLQKELTVVMQRLPSYLTTLRERVDPWLSQHFGITLAIDPTQIQEVITKNWKSAGDFAGQFLTALSSHGLALVGWVANIAVLPIVMFYMLRDWHFMIDEIAQLIPRRWFAKTAEIAGEIDLMLGEFLRGQLSVMLIMSAFYALGLWMAGLELAIPIGIIAGIITFIPYLGPTTGIIMAMLAGLLQFSNLSQLIPVMGVFAAGQVVESFFVTPLLVGDRIGLHPAMVIFALMAGGQLFGFTGVLLALPVSAALAVGIKHAKQHYLTSNVYLK